MAGMRQQQLLSPPQIDHTAVLPSAATCGPSLVLPVKVEGVKGFNKSMCLAIHGCFGFGQV